MLLLPAAAMRPCCSEIILRPYQFCNLTEVVVRDTDDLASLQRKARLAAILGTFQASLVDFPYLHDIWRHNTAEVRRFGLLARLCTCAPCALHVPLDRG